MCINITHKNKLTTPHNKYEWWPILQYINECISCVCVLYMGETQVYYKMYVHDTIYTLIDTLITTHCSLETDHTFHFNFFGIQIWHNTKRFFVVFFYFFLLFISFFFLNRLYHITLSTLRMYYVVSWVFIVRYERSFLMQSICMHKF